MFLIVSKSFAKWNNVFELIAIFKIVQSLIEYTLMDFR